MSIDRLNYISALLKGQTTTEPARTQKDSPDKPALAREIATRAKDLHQRLALFHGFMTDKRVGNRINLGTNPQTINWEAMPPEVAACFQPEFDYQPQDITAFYITSQDNTGQNGERSVSIYLDRGGRWWSYVIAGAIVRKDYCGDATSVMCLAKTAQPKQAREAMASLESSLWGGALDSKDRGLPHLYNNLNGLKLTEAVLGFAAAELERQLTTPAAS